MLDEMGIVEERNSCLEGANLEGFLHGALKVTVIALLLVSLADLWAVRDTVLIKILVDRLEGCLVELVR